MESSSEQDVRAALEDLLGWDELARSPQLAALLRYVVEQKLAHREEAIKAYSIAVDVFNRNEAFDPQTDPIVRVQARRLRRLLTRYYATGQSRARVRIEIPVGGYVPRFVVQDPVASADEDPAPIGPPREETGKSRIPETGGLARQMRPLAVLLVLAALFWAGAAWFLAWQAERSASPIQGPVVFVAAFENLAIETWGDPVAAGLGTAIVDLLDEGVGIDARFAGDTPADISGLGGERDVFSITGVVRRSGAALDYTAVLTDMGSGEQVDDLTITVPTEGAVPLLSLSEVAQRVAARFGDHAGPLHRRAQDWILTPETGGRGNTIYPCVVGQALYRRAPDPVLGAVVLACVRAIQEGPEAPAARAIEAAMEARSLWLFGAPVPGAGRTLNEAAAMARDALSAAPEAALVWQLAAFVSLVEGDHVTARARYNAALQLNPAAIDAIAGFSVVDSFAGNWEPALRRARLVEDTVFQRADWHGLAFALYALRQQRFEDALAMAAPIAETVPALGPVLMVAAAAPLGETAIAGRYLPRLMSRPEFQENGILPALRRYLLDPSLLAQIASGLSQAGLSLDRLTGPY